MMLYLVRHAAAEEAHDGKSDAERALTREGIEKFRRAAKGFVKILGDGGLPLIFTSPLVRARQTAELLSDTLGDARLGTEVRIEPALAPPGELSDVLRMARESGEAVAAVGHEPYLSEWVGQLCFQRSGGVEMKKGAVAGIELSKTGSRGTLLFLIQPGMLRKL